MTEELSANRRKAIAKLRSVKERREARKFTAEGTKCIEELLPYYRCEAIVATTDWIETHCDTASQADTLRASRADMERISALSTAPDAIGVFAMADEDFSPAMIAGGLTVALDGVQDPGNLGTIIRCCDWFGVSHIICSHNTVDLYNPKVIQSTMGAISRVKVWYVDLRQVIQQSRLPVFGTFLDGDNIYSADLPGDAIIVMGNEGRGISREVAEAVTRRLYIPPYPADADHVESLNVSMATAVTLSQFRAQWQRR